MRAIKKLIKRIVGEKEGTQASCQCNECMDMCETPCWPTPDEVMRLVVIGYVRKLELKNWVIDGSEIEIVVPKRSDNGYCVFFKKGKCLLHRNGLKPREGRYAHHSHSSRDAQNFRADLARLWNTAEGEGVVKYFVMRLVHVH